MRDLTRRLTHSRRYPAMLIGTSLFLLLLVLAIFAPFLAPYDPMLLQPELAKSPPTLSHLLGTDFVGRDIFSRLLYSLRLAYGSGLLAIIITAAFGIILGLWGGYYNSWVD